MKLETRQIPLNGTKVRYLYGGRGKPLLFLHGWPAQPPTYRHALELLAEHFTVYAPYMFDMKCSSIGGVAGSVRTLAKKLGITKAAVVGISFGGAVAGLISHDKKLVSKLVLINTAGVPRQASFAKMLANLVRSSLLMLARGKVSHFFHRYASSAAFMAGMGHSGRRKLFREIRASTKTHCCYLFQKIPVETAIIWCSKDDVFPATAAEVLNKMIRNSKLAIVDGDHYWPFHKPKHFAETIVAHVK
ncbi:alpha/beta hydrolase [Candidatus Woesearchaeota archaeon]|nr:alpha/beta hydrolase [Candidatus Woesearchaeota archaeon]